MGCWLNDMSKTLLLTYSKLGSICLKMWIKKREGLPQYGILIIDHGCWWKNVTNLQNNQKKDSCKLLFFARARIKS